MKNPALAWLVAALRRLLSTILAPQAAALQPVRIRRRSPNRPRG
jgi:hypothetical protein